MRILGVDLAWGEGTANKQPNETGVIAIESNGKILDAGWTTGVDATFNWINKWSGSDALAMIDAPLVVNNDSGQRLCEKQVGQRYYPWKIAANSSNRNLKCLAGVSLRERLERENSWSYDTGHSGPPSDGLHLYEVYPYTTIVGIEELNYGVRPVYKRKPKKMDVADFKLVRGAACQLLLRQFSELKIGNAKIDFNSHQTTRELLNYSDFSTLSAKEYKHREDLIDAIICAWTGLLWMNFGFDRCQVLGDAEATIIAPARPSPRR